MYCTTNRMEGRGRGSAKLGLEPKHGGRWLLDRHTWVRAKASRRHPICQAWQEAAVLSWAATVP